MTFGALSQPSFLDKFLEHNDSVSTQLAALEHQMACMAPAKTASQAVTELLSKQPYRPLDLLVELGKIGFHDSEVKQAIAQLLHEGSIELGADRYLRAVDQAAA